MATCYYRAMKNEKYIKVGWVAYAFGVALTAMTGGPTGIVAVAGVAVMVIASILMRDSSTS